MVLLEAALLLSGQLVLVHPLIFFLRQSLVGISHSLGLHLDAREFLNRFGLLITHDRHEHLSLIHDVGNLLDFAAQLEKRGIRVVVIAAADGRLLISLLVLIRGVVLTATAFYEDSLLGSRGLKLEKLGRHQMGLLPLHVRRKRSRRVRSCRTIDCCGIHRRCGRRAYSA